MKIRKVVLLAFSLLFIFTAYSPFSYANDQQENLEVTYGEYEAERKVTIADNLVLTDTEIQRFWPAYKAYRSETKDIVNELIKLLQTLTKDTSNLSKVKAENIVERALDLETEHQQLLKDYILTLKRRSVLSGTKLLRYYELEMALIAAFKNNLAGVLPLVDGKKEKTN